MTMTWIFRVQRNELDRIFTDDAVAGLAEMREARPELFGKAMARFWKMMPRGRLTELELLIDDCTTETYAH